jgi:hypothetical protein
MVLPVLLMQIVVELVMNNVCQEMEMDVQTNVKQSVVMGLLLRRQNNVMGKKDVLTSVNQFVAMAFCSMNIVMMEIILMEMVAHHFVRMSIVVQDIVGMDLFRRLNNVMMEVIVVMEHHVMTIMNVLVLEMDNVLHEEMMGVMRFVTKSQFVETFKLKQENLVIMG